VIQIVIDAMMSAYASILIFITAISKATQIDISSCNYARDPIRSNISEPVFDDGRPLFLWPGGGSGGMGNTLVGYLSSFYDAMRLSRDLVAARIPEFRFNDLTLAFRTGVPFASEEMEFEGTRQKRRYPLVHIEAGKPIGFRFQNKPIEAMNKSIVQSRHNNVHFERPTGYSNGTAIIDCFFKVLGCPAGPAKGVNIMKQEQHPANYCGETQALRRLILGVSDRLLGVRGIFESSWVGDLTRLQSLLLAKSTDHGLPIWDVAVHARVGFKFVEQGEDEAANADRISAWLELPRTKKELGILVGQVRQRLLIIESSERRACVYVASETAMVRHHIAELVRASVSLVDVDFFSFAGTPHPVDINGNKRSTRVGEAAHTDSEKERHDTANLLFPYLEWWALAHSRHILVRRGLDVLTIGSTYSGTAHLYGGWQN
jgi:hypothetical protein